MPDENTKLETDLLSAAIIGAKWMRWWLDENDCECEYGHTCGKNERLRELEQIDNAIEARRTNHENV